MSSLRQRIRAGERTLGSWLNLGNATVAEIMADAGFDWLVIDLEHTATTVREAENMIRVIEMKGISPLVRLTSNDANQAKRMLDAGAHGIIVPMVETRADAEAAARALRYPPVGTRGVGLGRAQGFGRRFKEYVEWLATDAILIAQVEHVRGIENLEEILSVDAVDATMIGPYDLSASVGRAGQFEHEDVQELLDRYESVSKRLGRAMGAHVVDVDPEPVRRMIDRGFSMIAVGVDFLYVSEGSRRTLNALR